MNKLFSCTYLDNHSKFDPGLSWTYRADGSPISIKYGTGNMTGFLGSDSVTVRNKRRKKKKEAYCHFEMEKD